MTEDIIRQRQSNVSKEGQRVEEEIIRILKEDQIIRERCIIGKGKNGKVEEEQFLLVDFQTQEETRIDSELLSFKYNGDRYYMDADIIIYDKLKKRIICVISSKKSFRERGAQSAYWAIKKKACKKHFPYILATPDNDKELFDPEDPTKHKKWRVILQYEMDHVFIIGDTKKTYQDNNFSVGNPYLVDYVKSLLS